MSEDSNPYPGAALAWTTVAILMLAYVFSFVDRQILGLLVEPISKDLRLSDTQFSLLQGLSFAVFYTFCGIPIARLADTRSRRGIIAFGVVLWSLMTAGCGLVRSYAQLLVLRMGVGVGEATLSPSAYSLIVDSFPQSLRATALSVYSMGIYIGSGVAFLLGGLVINFAVRHEALTLPAIGGVKPWQLVFLVLGTAGLIFSLALLAIREPLRKGVGAGVAVPLREVWAYIAVNRATILHHNLGFAMMSFASYGAAAWAPSVFIRVHGWTAGDVGLVYGLLIGIFGSAGLVTGGRLADRLGARGRVDATLRVGLFGAIGAIPFTLAWPLMRDANLAAALMGPALFFIAMPFGVAPAAIQDIMPNNMRSQASALYLFIVNLIGLGIGPTAVALFTDHVFHDRKAVGESLLIVSVIAEAGAVLLLWRGLKPYRQSVDRLKRWSAVAAS